MTSRLAALGHGAVDVHRLAVFWAELLGREQREEADDVLLAGDDTQVGLRFVPGGAAKRGPNRVHLHLTSTDEDDQRRTVTTALGLGASHLDVGQQPDEGFVVLADPEGNEFCVIEAGNRFLAGCGFLGELACDGTRAVGVFWSQALNWPLVWDQNEETAVQSPRGGTKVAWGGPPVAPRAGGRPQHFLLEPVDEEQQTEVDRLVSLGATRLGAREDSAVVLADPDGVEFVLLPR